MLSNLFMVALHFIVGLLKWVLIIGSAVALPFVISGLIHLIYYRHKGLRFKQRKYTPTVRRRNIFVRLFKDFPKRVVLDMLHKDPDSFPHSGIVMIVGEQGAGKTTCAAHLLRCMKDKYPHVKILSNTPEWRYGFTTAIPLDDQKIRVANYVTKYITKGSDKIFGKYFWSSKNIQREPHVILTDTDFSAVNAEVFQPLAFNDNLQFKYESNFMYIADVPTCPMFAECKRKYPDRKYPPCNCCPNNLESALDECAMLATEMEDLQNE